MMRKLSVRNKKQNARRALFQPRVESLERREVLSGFQTLAPAYLTATAPSVEITPLVTVGDTVNDNYGAVDQFPYRMVGIPDGLGAFDNGDGTFTVLMNHEIGNTSGIVRDHGSRGAFVSRWVIDKDSLEVLEGDDLIKTLYVWDSNPASPTYNQFVVGTGAIAAMNRLCSADLPDPTAFYFDPTPEAPNSGDELGTLARIFMNGEETSNGRAFAHVATGPEKGTSWELPWTGKYAWENHVTSPFSQEKTIVIGLDDSSRNFSSEGATQPSEVYVWVGEKQASGLEIEKAGLRTGILHGLRVGLPGGYDANEGTVTSGERFELVALNDQTNNVDFTALQQESIDESITQFRRVEDGHFDPTNPDVFYFVTTDQFGGSTRLWKLTFDDITNPEAGGVIEIAFDSPAGVDGEMFDNMTVNENGDVLLQEDPGGNPYLAKVWQWDASTGDLTQVAEHNPALFGAAGLDLFPHIPGVQSTQDEESSGIIDLSHILGEGFYLADVQAHYSFTATTDPTGELVQAGQLLIINTNAASASLADGVLTVEGTINDDEISVEKNGKNFDVLVNGMLVGSFRKNQIDRININGYEGDDFISLGNTGSLDSIVHGGAGDDVICAANGSNQLYGEEGDDVLLGGNGADFLFGGEGNDYLFGGNGADALFGEAGDDWLFGENGADLLDGGDNDDWLFGGNGADLLLNGEHNSQ